MSPRGWAAFAAMSAVWGVPYLFIKVAVDDGVSPAFVSFARVVIAAVVLLALAAHAGGLGSLRGRWRWVAVYAVAEIAIPFPLIAAGRPRGASAVAEIPIPFPLIAAGEQRVSSSLTAILIACVPLMVAVIALRFDPSERAPGFGLMRVVVGV